MRYIRLYFVCLKRAIVSRLEYKMDTFIGILSFFLTNAASLLSIYFILQNIPSLNQWNMWQLGFLYGFTMIPVAIDHFFSDDLWCVAYWKVRTGELDKFYLRPVPVLFQVIAETFQLEAFGELLVGIIMLIICATKGRLGIQWNFGIVFLLIVAAIFGAILITSLKIMIAALAFYMKRSGPLLQIIYNFISYTKYPLSIYPRVIRGLLTFVFPFAVIISLPVETFLGLGNAMNPYALSAIIVGVSLAVLGLAILFWSKSAKRYQSSGS